jgi:hypothetical protein
MMRRAAVFFAVFGAAVVLVPLAAYLVERPSPDPLGDKLRSYGFFPIEPPSTLVRVGSLYYVSPDVRQFTAICNADTADVGGFLNESRSLEIEQELRENGSFTAKVDLNLHPTVKAGSDAAFIQTVRFSLTDVLLDEITLGDNGLIYTNLMSKPSCNQVAMQLVNSDGYVCQGQRILRAKAEIDRKNTEKVAGDAQATFAGKSDGAKTEGSTTGDRTTTEREGLPLADSVLTYGVQMTPMCLVPKTAHFPRILPRTAVGRAYNFVLFHIVEPLLPPERDTINVAETASPQAK